MAKLLKIIFKKEFDPIHLIREFLKNPKDLLKAIDNLLVENAELKKKIEKQEAKQLISIKNELLQKVQKINDVNFIGQQLMLLMQMLSKNFASL